jgi:hypothetical protein
MAYNVTYDSGKDRDRNMTTRTLNAVFSNTLAVLPNLWDLTFSVAGQKVTSNDDSTSQHGRNLDLTSTWRLHGYNLWLRGNYVRSAYQMSPVLVNDPILGTGLQSLPATRTEDHQLMVGITVGLPENR